MGDGDTAGDLRETAFLRAEGLEDQAPSWGIARHTSNPSRDGLARSSLGTCLMYPMLTRAGTSSG